MAPVAGLDSASRSIVVPQTIRQCTDYLTASRYAIESSPDKVLGYACTVLSDGLLLLEFRDAIHEGDGEVLGATSSRAGTLNMPLKPGCVIFITNASFDVRQVFCHQHRGHFSCSSTAHSV